MAFHSAETARSHSFQDFLGTRFLYLKGILISPELFFRGLLLTKFLIPIPTQLKFLALNDLEGEKIDL